MKFSFRFMMYHGLEFSGPTHLVSKKDAEAFARKEHDHMQRIGEAEARKFAKGCVRRQRRVALPAPSRGMTFAEAVLSYYQQQCTRQKSEYAIKANFANLTKLVGWAGEDKLLADIDEDLIRVLMERRRLDYRYGDKALGQLSEGMCTKWW